jgi:hypothetical protein
MTTATALGSLWLSSGPSISGRGKLMALSLAQLRHFDLILRAALRSHRAYALDIA